MNKLMTLLWIIPVYLFMLTLFRAFIWDTPQKPDGECEIMMRWYEIEKNHDFCAKAYMFIVSSIIVTGLTW